MQQQKRQQEQELKGERLEVVPNTVGGQSEEEEFPLLPAEYWKKLKLKPKIDVSQNAEAFEIYGFIPGINEKELKVTLNNTADVMTISGYRLPSPAEELDLKRNLLRRIQLATGGQIGKFPLKLYQTKMLQMGAGRFGSFSESFRIPEIANLDKALASYERGVLRVTIPKTQRRAMRPQYGFSYPYSYGTAPLGFFGDRESNWW